MVSFAIVPKYTSSFTSQRRNVYPLFPVLPISMHPYHVLADLLHPVHAREDGFTMSEVMWSVAVVAMIAGLAYFVGPVLGADWADFVGDPTR